MSYRVALPRDAGFDEWRPSARAALAHDIPPDRIRFETSPSCGDLFAVSELPAGTPTDRPFHVSKRFRREASDAAIHRDPGRFDFLYGMLWRQRENRRLMEMALDPDVVRLGKLVKSVRRDLHKMTAFVRFRRVPSDTEERYVAWFEPDHFIVPRAAEFFRRRFTGMNWSILSPDKSAHWNGHELVLADGMTRSRLHEFEDEKEDLWRIYFASIFNPTRLKIKAMQAEMPKKYWKNLPEAGLIPELVRSAETMTQRMLQTAPSTPPRRHLRLAERTPSKADARPDRVAERETLETLRAQAMKCRSCPLWANATQTVFGEGPQTAEIMLVAEQPGDSEDLAGRPLVGPAGRLLDVLLKDAGLAREDCYVTNAVKHFKHEPRGKTRLHKTPAADEIDHCRWWLAKEIALVEPRLIVALGATAARSLLAYKGALSGIRGSIGQGLGGRPVLTTLHPAYLLRLRDRQRAAAARRVMVDDLRRARDVTSDGRRLPPSATRGASVSCE